MRNSKSSPKLVVIGQGYVGLPLSIAGAKNGYKVVGIDSDSTRVNHLSQFRTHSPEVSSSDLQETFQSGLYSASTDYRLAQGFDVLVVTVPTPLKNGLPFLDHISESARSFAPHISPGCLVVLESTTYPGTTEELLLPILEELSGLKAGDDFSLGYSPERIDPGNTSWTLQSTPKIVSGVNKISLERVAEFYDSLGISTVPVSGTREAELAKLLENTFRHVNIALVNELAIFAHQLGVSIWESIDAAATKPFGFMAFKPGPGVGGHCLPVDPSYLSWAILEKTGNVAKFVELANTINSDMPDYIVQRCEILLRKCGADLRGSRVLIVGLAYKPQTSDMRESPAFEILKGLSRAGALVSAMDNQISQDRWPPGTPRITAVNAAEFDLAVVVTDHGDGSALEILEKVPLVFDTRNTLKDPRVAVL